MPDLVRFGEIRSIGIVRGVAFDGVRVCRVEMAVLWLGLWLWREGWDACEIWNSD